MKHTICTCTKAKRARTTMSVVLTCFFVSVIAMTVITTPGAVSVNAANAGDPIRGKDLFEKRCGGCHSLDARKEGPRLRNVYGRKAGSISSFKYSDALKGHRSCGIRIHWTNGSPIQNLSFRTTIWTSMFRRQTNVPISSSTSEYHPEDRPNDLNHHRWKERWTLSFSKAWRFRSSTNFTISLTGLPAIGLTLKTWCRRRTQRRSKGIKSFQEGANFRAWITGF